MLATKARFSVSVSILILCALSAVKASRSLNNELKAFESFLDTGYLHYGILIHDEILGSTQHQIETFFGKYYMRYFRACSEQSKCDFRRIFDNSFSRAGIFLPILESSLVYQQILEVASVNGLFNNSYAWFILNDEKDSALHFIRHKLESLRIEVNADITVVAKEGNSSLLLYDVYKMCPKDNSLLNAEYKGNWTLTTGLSILPEFQKGFVRRRRNFCNLTIKAGTALLEKPHNISNSEYLENRKDFRHFDMMQRKTYNLMKNLEPFFNISLDIVFASKWGEPLENGTWTGVIGDVLKKQVEFAICPIRFSTARAHVLRYTPELHTEHIRFLLRHPRHATIRNIFFEPLSPTVWWCIMAMAIFLIIQLGIHVRQEYSAQKLYVTHSTQTRIEARWDFVVLQILEVIFMQGPSPELYRFLSTRTFITAGCIFSIMLQQFYSAFIVGSLLATPPRTLTTLEALYNSSLVIGMEQISYNYELFTNTTNQLVRSTYTKRICKNPATNILSLEKGVERIRRDAFAFHVSLNRAYSLLIAQLSESAFCDLQEIAIYPPFSAGLGASKDAIYREYLATSILFFRETGLMQYNEKQWAVQPIDCSLVQGNVVEVDMEHFSPALMLLAMAIGVSFIALLMELIWKWREQQSTRI